MVCNIINLPHRKDRRESALREADSQNMEIVFWEGIIDKPSYKGVCNAHKQIVIDARKRGLEKVLIGEDDIKFLGEGAFEYFIKNEPKEYDIYFAGIFEGKIYENNLVYDPQGLTLYMVHKRFYDYFIGIPDDYHLDCNLKGLGKYVVCDPFCVTQHNGISDNNGYYCDYSNSHANRKLYYKKDHSTK